MTRVSVKVNSSEHNQGGAMDNSNQGVLDAAAIISAVSALVYTSAGGPPAAVEPGALAAVSATCAKLLR